MNNAALAFALVAASSVPALADTDSPVAHTDQLVVVTPNAPIVVTPNGAAAPGAVAPGAVAVQASAPVNEDWNNVSHINGAPVKVGERGDYLHKFKKTNISTNPIGWIFGVYGLSVSHAVHNNVAVRLDGNIFNSFMDEMSGYEVSASLPIYLKRAYSGPFIEPGIVSRGIKDTREYLYDSYGYEMEESETETSFGPSMLFGWHSTFDSGLNVSAAAGAMRNLNAPEPDEYGYREEPIEFVGYFRLGYAL